MTKKQVEVLKREFAIKLLYEASDRIERMAVDKVVSTLDVWNIVWGMIDKLESEIVDLKVE